MTRIRVKSAEGAVRYALGHLRSQDMMRHPDRIEHYVAISIQDSTDGGFGLDLLDGRILCTLFKCRIPVHE